MLAEGGPALNGQLAAAALLDELCLTVSPLLAEGDAKRILAGPTLVPGPGCRLWSVCEQDGFLFLRYPLQWPGQYRNSRVMHRLPEVRLAATQSR